MKEITITTDGASRGNPGRAAWAFQIRCNNALLTEYAEVNRSPATNNEMEYLALANALTFIIDLYSDDVLKQITVTHYTDSQLVNHQVMREWNVKDPKLRKYCEQIWGYINRLGGFRSNWMPREDTIIQACDRMCNEALDGFPPRNSVGSPLQSDKRSAITSRIATIRDLLEEIEQDLDQIERT